MLDHISSRDDAYLIFQDPYHPVTSQLAPDTIAQFRLQKYAFDPDQQTYHSVFPSEFPITLKIHQICPRYDRERDLPDCLDGHLLAPLPIFTDQAMRDQSYIIRHDPVLASFTADTRLVFRYNPIRRFGVLVHYGYDFTALEQQPRSLLWRTAFNLDHGA